MVSLVLKSFWRMEAGPHRGRVHFITTRRFGGFPRATHCEVAAALSLGCAEMREALLAVGRCVWVWEGPRRRLCAENISLYERGLSASDLSYERRYMADQKLSKPPKTRNEMMRACSRHQAVGRCDTVRERALRSEALRGVSRSVVR